MQKQKTAIQEQLATHDGTMKVVRDKLFDMFNDESLSVRERIEAAKEIRQNITSMQKIASMSDEQGDFNVVIVLNDQPMKKTVDEEGNHV